MSDFKVRRLGDGSRDSKDSFESLSVFPDDLFQNNDGGYLPAISSEVANSHVDRSFIVVPARRRVRVPKVVVEKPVISTATLATYFHGRLTLHDSIISTTQQIDIKLLDRRSDKIIAREPSSKAYKRSYSPASIASYSSPKSMEKFVK